MRSTLLATLLLVAPLPPLALAQEAAPEPAADSLPVVVHGDTLFHVAAAIPPFTLQQRVLALRTRFVEAARTADVTRDSVVVSESDRGSLLVMGEAIVAVVLDQDAEAAGMPRRELALRWAEGANRGLRHAASETRWRNLLLSVGEALLATAVFVALVWLLARVNRWLTRRFHAWAAARVEQSQIGQLRLVTPAQLARGVLAIARLLRFAALAALTYFWLVALLGSFPRTRGMAGQLLGYVVEPLQRMLSAVVAYLPSLLFIVLAVLALRAVLQLIRSVFTAVGTGSLSFEGFPAEWADPTYKIVRTMVLVFGLILIFPYLPGAGSDAFKAISLFAGALFSLGSSGAVANIVAGTVITYTRAFKVGDSVRIGDAEGTVLEQSLLVTRLRNASGIEISIPSATVLAGHVRNYSTMAAEGRLVLQTRVTIGYDVPWRRIHQLLLEAAARTEGVRSDPAPFVVQEALNDYYPTYCLHVYTDQATGMQRMQLVSRLNEQVQDAFFAGGVEILSPAYTAIRDGNRTAMPAEYLPPGYRAPGFGLERREP
ncbi:MAG: mechanosensitive ion channel family protein [Gemmatimonadales bacterium]|jgi:small-conductance mechanosensitive channel|nr:mechanosensitive ion channel family protein [Gemmatimonadales bacterium]